MNIYAPTKTKDKQSGLTVVFVGIVAVSIAAYAFFTIGTVTSLPDWKVFWEASALSNPYDRYGFLNPYWAAWIIAPLHLLTRDYLIAYGLWSVCTVAVAIFVLRDSKFLIMASVISPFFLHQIINGQIDAIVLIGYYYLLTQSNYQWLAPVLMLTKPQSMIGALVVWGFNNINKRQLYYALAAIAGLSLLGFVLYGNWILAAYNNVQNGLYQGVNASWVFNYPLAGIGLLILGIWRKNVFLGGLGTLFLTPYIAMHSLWVYWTAWLMERPNKYLVIAMSALSWYVALRFTI